MAILAASQSGEKLAFAGMTLNLSRLSLETNGKTIPLRPKSFEVLRYLAENPGRVITKDELIDKVWSGASVTDDSLVQCVKEIREAIGQDHRWIIKTLPRRGYLFVAPVNESTTVNISAAPVSPIRYAKSGDVHIAYRVWGQGDIDLVFFPGFVTHIENLWSEPGMARFLRRMGQFARVVMFDKRGTGMSDRVDKLPGMEERVDDVRAVMDTVGIQRASVVGPSEGGSLAAYFAATHPQRCEALVLYGAFAHFRSWIRTDEALQQLLQYIDTSWGSGASLPMFAPSMVGNAAFEDWWGRFERLGANPAAAMALMRMNSQIDISDILPVISVPTLVIHRTGDVTVDVEAGRLLAARIPNARLVELSGNDHLPWVGDNSDEILWQMEQFLTQPRSAPAPNRVLATVLMMEVVASANGHRALAKDNDRMVGQQLACFHGRQIKSHGDRILATFDGPSRAIHAALALKNSFGANGIIVRTGIHIGEVEPFGEDVRGAAIHIAERLMKSAIAGEVVVSATVKDVSAGSGIVFHEKGTDSLDGAAEALQLFRASLPSIKGGKN